MSTPVPTTLDQATVGPADLNLPPTQPVDISGIVAARLASR